MGRFVRERPGRTPSPAPRPYGRPPINHDAGQERGTHGPTAYVLHRDTEGAPRGEAASTMRPGTFRPNPTADLAGVWEGRSPLFTARSFRHALRPAAGVLAASVLSSGLVLAAPAAPAAAAERIGTRLSITPYRQDKVVGERASFVVTLGDGTRRLSGRPVTFWTRSVTSSTWSKYVTRNTNTAGQTGLAFYVKNSTYVRATWPGDTAYAPIGSVTAGVVAHASIGPQVVTEASRHAGKPYQWGAVGPDRFDCSGYTLYVFSRFGKKLPHNSQQQYNTVQKVARSSVRVGDLIFSGSSTSSIGHVGIYAGNGEIWHSPRSGSTVRRVKIYASSWWVGRVA